MNLIIEIIGWLGMLLILIAYYLISSKRLEAKSIFYQLLNLGGSRHSYKRFLS
jgi:hypothetical protein